jgi:cephalosporin hydroxylase
MKKLLAKCTNKFFQWLWIEEKPIKYRPEFTVEKVLNPVTMYVREELDHQDLETGKVCGFKIQLFWPSLKNRFFDKILFKAFHKRYYHADPWIGDWLGTRILKFPTDLFMYQEIIYKNKPDVIIECGTANGGLTLFLATICDLMGHGKIATIDVSPNRHKDLDPEAGEFRPYHDRIMYLLGSDTDPGLVEYLKENISPEESVMVILDSDHTKKHVLKQLEIYSDIVTVGQYLIVEDTNVGYWGKRERKENGPLFALREWLKDHPEFRIDYAMERHILTANMCGYLKKVEE